MDTPSRDDLRRWVFARRSADVFGRDENRGAPIDAAQSLAFGFALINVAGALQGWPPSEDAIDRRDIELARERWVRVRRQWPQR
jgi:hypothetical protein